MKSSKVSLAGGGVLCAEATEHGAAPAASVASLTKDKPLDANIIRAFFEGSDAKKVAEKVAAAEGSRMAYLLRTFPKTSVQGVKDAVKNYREGYKTAEKSQSDSARVRSAEIQALYGAFTWGAFKPDNLGYHAAVSEARQVLKSKGIRWDGARVPTREEREDDKAAKAKAQAVYDAEKAVRERERKGEEVSDKEREAILDRAADTIARASMRNLANSLLKKYGPEQCQWLIDALDGAMAAMHQQAQEKQAAQG